MKFIESLVGLSPDHGSGITEAGIIFVVFAFICTCLLPRLMRVAQRRSNTTP